jgi:hypothetical protein
LRRNLAARCTPREHILAAPLSAYDSAIFISAIGPGRVKIARQARIEVAAALLAPMIF